MLLLPSIQHSLLTDNISGMKRRGSLDMGDPDGHGCHQPRRLSSECTWELLFESEPEESNFLNRFLPSFPHYEFRACVTFRKIC